MSRPRRRGDRALLAAPRLLRRGGGIPVADPHAPNNPEGFTRLELDGVECYLATGLKAEDVISVSLEGFRN